MTADKRDYEQERMISIARFLSLIFYLLSNGVYEH